MFGELGGRIARIGCLLKVASLLREDVLARVAVHHGCDRVVEIGAQGSTRRALHVGEEHGSEWLGHPRPYLVQSTAAIESSVLAVSESALASIPPDILVCAPICLVIEDTDARTETRDASTDRLGSLQAVVEAAGLDHEFVGWARSSRGPDVAVCLARRGAWRGPSDPPTEFRVLATITTYNEADVIVPAIRALLDQGIEVHLLDNWSTDATPQLVTDAFGGRVTIEYFPRDGPDGLYQLGALLGRIAEIASNSDADWIIYHDADECRHGPWSGVDLRAALYRVEMEGYNAANHTVIEFPPVDDGFPPGGDFEQYFTRFMPTETVANRIQIKAWKGRQVDLRSSGGHEAIFPGRQVHPFNFVLKHYPVRSQAHGERKVLRERKPRVVSEEKGRWHTHYDHVRSGYVFLRDPNELLLMGDDFSERWLLERLYGFPPPEVPYLPSGVRHVVPESLRRVRLLKSARSVRRLYRVARGRHPDSGRR